ncbi:MAG: hypothetical protein ACLQVY_01525 [Limisphaerales bacterium]
MSPPADGSAVPAAGWQPLTFGGVAVFAGVRLGRLLVVELLVAAILSASAVWFMHRSYSPVILQAIDKMPETARIVRGQLQGVPSALISESKFLAIAVTPDADHEIGQGADLQIQLRRTDFCANSVFRSDWGLEFDYGSGTSLDLGRSQLEPWWGAWQPVVWTAFGVALVPVLLLIWALVGVVYMVPAFVIAWFTDRNLSWMGAWQLSSAALMPGTLLLAAAIFSYGWRAVDLLGFAFFYLAHLILGWVYLAGSVRATPRLSVETAKRNPFST